LPPSSARPEDKDGSLFRRGIVTRSRSQWALAVVTAAAAVAIAAGLWRLHSATTGVAITQEHAGTIPVTIFAPRAAGPAPVVVIAHGFAGSQQLMQPFAVTLARNGYLALTFDFPGHGRNAALLPGGLADYAARTGALLGALDSVVALARGLPAADAHLALVGHSMASDVVVRYAQMHPEVEATVAVSLFLSREVTATSPRNLLVIDGALESAMLREEGQRIVAMVAGNARPGVTYGSFADGSARRLALAGGVEHIGVLYSRDSLAEALAWMNQVFGRQGPGFLDARGPWLGLLYLGLVALGWPLARLLPQVVPVPLGRGYGWRRLVPVAFAPALLTPLILWQFPGAFLPILLGDYLALHFALYGLLTAAGMWLVGRRRVPAMPTARVSRQALAVAVLTATAYAMLAIGIPTDWFVTSLAPTAGRVPLIAAMLCGTLPYFVADEWLTRGGWAPRGSYAITKLCFLLSLMLAITLNLERLFFLVIIVPAILAFFAVYGLFSGWTYRRTNHPLVGALANASAFAWAIAVTFPIVSR
jgi:hypothetical protein